MVKKTPYIQSGKIKKTDDLKNKTLYGVVDWCDGDIGSLSHNIREASLGRIMSSYDCFMMHNLSNFNSDGNTLYVASLFFNPERIKEYDKLIKRLWQGSRDAIARHPEHFSHGQVMAHKIKNHFIMASDTELHDIWWDTNNDVIWSFDALFMTRLRWHISQTKLQRG